MFFIVIDKNKCAGCGLCEETLPDYFSMRENIAVCRKGAVSLEEYDKLQSLKGDCPAEAISLKEQSEFFIYNGS